MTYEIRPGTHAPCELWIDGKKVAEGTHTFCMQVLDSLR
jgi:hypothetical protein